MNGTQRSNAFPSLFQQETSMGFSINAKTALVTGSNRGIGKAIVAAALQRGAKKVYAAVRDLGTATPLVDLAPDRVVPVEIDLLRPDTIRAAANAAADVDLVINNAGVLRTSGPLASDALEAYQYETEVNVLGLLRMAQAFAPVLQANGGGAFVQLNSVASLKCFADFATYSASKAAAYSLTQALRETLGRQGTLVVSVHPGPIATDMAVAAGIAAIAEAVDVVPEALFAALENGEFHCFPDKFARDVWTAYQPFAQAVIEG
jgi:NAD(P)-dependent dehydrogenase (short-subunit alcohol dehydrogenase family)